MLARAAPRRLRISIARRGTRQCRAYSTPGAAAASPPPGAHIAPAAASLTPFTHDLDRIAPSFPINGSQIRVLRFPADFYETLLDKIRHAERRIFISTLYIGKTETELVDALRQALRTKPQLKLSIVTDGLRGTREEPQPCCASLLASLVEEFGQHRVDIRLYHTPNLTGLRKRVIPKRINEGWGLQHMKIYGFDDEVILSGANLSNDYFTNRQDRYHLFASRDVTSYFWRLHRGIADLSFRVEPTNEPAGFAQIWPSQNAAPSPLQDPSKFVQNATMMLSRLVQQDLQPSQVDEQAFDTTVYPLVQVSQLMSPDTSTELPALTHILRTLSQPEYAKSSWIFTAGYFNPARSLVQLLLSTASTNNTVINASPFANGFYLSKGVSGMLPDAYTILARRFLRALHAKGKDSTITLKEWRQGTVNEPGGWTYHAKGLWVTLPGHQGPSMSLIGSSNYTKRSYSHDLEANALIVTKNEGLQKRLGEEQLWLQEHASKVTLDDLARNERRAGLHVRIAMWIVSLVGGAL